MDEKQWTTQEKRFYEQFQKMYEEDNCKVPELDRSFLQKDLTVSPPRRTYKKAFRVAAILMIIILSSSATALFIGNGYVDAIKDHIQKRMFTWNSGVIVTETEDSSEIEETWEITDPDLLQELQQVITDLKQPDYIPKGYQFQKIVVEQTTDHYYTVTYHYERKRKELLIVQIPIDSNADAMGAGDGETIKLSDRTISMWEDVITDTKGCTVFFSHSAVQISATGIKDLDLQKIAENLE